MKKVLSMLQEYTLMVKEKSKDQSLLMYELEELHNNSAVAVKIIIDINNKTLHKQILKHIAPQFQLGCDDELIENNRNVTSHEKKPVKKKK